MDLFKIKSLMMRIKCYFYNYSGYCKSVIYKVEKKDWIEGWIYCIFKYASPHFVFNRIEI